MRKPRDDRYRGGKKSQDGTFSCCIKAAVNIILDFYCKLRNINKTDYVNKTVMKQLQQDMKDTKVEISMQDLFNLKNPEEQDGNKYEQIGIPGIE